MKTAQPLVSVIIPCYNVSSFVEQAVNSIIRQTYTNLEIWIIDDGSTDDTLSKIIAIKDNRIKVEAFANNTEKIGAVNEVLHKVNGDFICFQDSDDWSESSRIERQVTQFQSEADLGICFTRSGYAGSSKGFEEKVALTNDELRNEFLNFGKPLNKGYTSTICGTMMISRAALEETGGYHPYFKGRVAEDIHWIYRILKKFKGYTINEILYYYRIRQSSLTGISFSGEKVKYAYSCEILSRIIHMDIYENIDILSEKNGKQLGNLELAACEEKLQKTLQLLNRVIETYETSFNYKLGKFLLSPWKYFNSADGPRRRTKNRSKLKVL